MRSVVLFFAFQIWCPAQSFRIADALSAPFPSELTAAPAGARLAWVFNERGARNVGIAEPPAYRGRRLTSYTQDDGQEITELSWSQDGRAIAYVRGEGTNRSGEYPNPTHDPKGVRQMVWVAMLDGTAREIGEGHFPAASRDRVYFVRGGQIWSAPLEGNDKPAQLIHARGQAETLRLSPDGARLAFTTARVDHSFIGVYDIVSARLRFVDPSTDRDTSPVWSPDSRQVAFLRTTSGRFTPGPRRTAHPWSIRIADAATGEGREVWRAMEGAGSAFRVLGSNQPLFWAAGDRLVFPWERDGWLHLYTVPVRGGDARLLTPGAFEVEHVTLASRGDEIVYSSNQGDIDRRHIWKVTLNGDAPVAVTKGNGIECEPAISSDGKTIAFLRSDTQLPLRPATTSGDLAPDAIPPGFPKSAMVEPQQVIFAAADGLEIHGQLFLPKNRSGERAPAVIFLHGGSRRQMLLGWHYMYYYSNAYAMNQYLASRGYVVLSVNYRSGIGYGLNFREALNYGPSGASEFNDVLGAGIYLRGRPDVDPARIGLWGGSYGGYLTAMGLARASDQFAAGVDLHGVHDWSNRDMLAGLAPEVSRLAFQSSPMAYVKDWRSPVLLIHGDDDRNVNFSQTVDLVARLRQQKVYFEELIFPDEIHDFLLHNNWVRAYTAAADFFERKLRARK